MGHTVSIKAVIELRIEKIPKETFIKMTAKYVCYHRMYFLEDHKLHSYLSENNVIM